MKVCIIQPKYSTDYSKSDEYFQKEIDYLNQCDDSMDIIVLPESCDVPCLAKTYEQRMMSIEKYNAPIIEKARETARRCNSMVFINAVYKAEKGYHNTTYSINRKGEIVGLYFKQHPVPSEIKYQERDSEYVFEHNEPTIVEMEGIRFGFLTCYDFYFYEYFPNFAKYNVDVIIGCSHQRSDTHLALDIMSRFLAYNTNTYVIRSSVSMDENSDIGGGSTIVAPTGEVLVNMLSKVGLATVEIDINKKYYKPAGYGNPDAAHHEYIELGRNPWNYRPSGSAISLPDTVLSYPRTCAHRGFNTVAPENSMPAFGAAVAMGAEEIEFDLWVTTDGEIVSCHDATLERVSNGEGVIYKKSYDELSKLDFGVKYADEFKGLRILKFEDILKKFSCHTIMNIHLKDSVLSSESIAKIVGLIKKYDCEKYVYFMSGYNSILEKLQKECPHITRCCGGEDNKWEIVERAIKYGCKKVQLVKDYFNQEMIDKAHANGIVCNVFWSDDVEETKKFLDMGIDVILTNDFNKISQVVNTYKK